MRRKDGAEAMSIEGIGQRVKGDQHKERSVSEG